MSKHSTQTVNIFPNENLSIAEKILTIIQYIIGFSIIVLTVVHFTGVYETFYIFTPLCIVFLLINAWLNHKRNRTCKKNLIFDDDLLHYGLYTLYELNKREDDV